MGFVSPTTPNIRHQRGDAHGLSLSWYRGELARYMVWEVQTRRGMRRHEAVRAHLFLLPRLSPRRPATPANAGLSCVLMAHAVPRAPMLRKDHEDCKEVCGVMTARAAIAVILPSSNPRHKRSVSSATLLTRGTRGTRRGAFLLNAKELCLGPLSCARTSALSPSHEEHEIRPHSSLSSGCRVPDHEHGPFSNFGIYCRCAHCRGHGTELELFID